MHSIPFILTLDAHTRLPTVRPPGRGMTDLEWPTAENCISSTHQSFMAHRFCKHLSCRGMTDLEWPTATTNAMWRTVVTRLGKHPHVWWGVSNEPEYNFDGAQDVQVRWGCGGWGDVERLMQFFAARFGHAGCAGGL